MGNLTFNIPKMGIDQLKQLSERFPFILEHIIVHLNSEDIQSICLTSKYLYRTISSNNKLTEWLKMSNDVIKANKIIKKTKKDIQSKESQLAVYEMNRKELNFTREEIKEFSQRKNKSPKEQKYLLFLYGREIRYADYYMECERSVTQQIFIKKQYLSNLHKVQKEKSQKCLEYICQLRTKYEKH